MKRFALLSLLLVLAVSSYGFAQVSVTINVTHDTGVATAYTGSGSSLGIACGNAFNAAYAALVSGDVMQIPAETACYLNGGSDGDYDNFPPNIKVIGESPELTTLILGYGADFVLSGNDQVMQGLTINSAGSRPEDGNVVNVSPTTGTFTMSYVNANTALDCDDDGTLGVSATQSGSVLLSHVNFMSGGYSAISYASWGTGAITVRDSTIATYCNNAMTSYGNVNIYNSLITNSPWDTDDNAYYPSAGTVNFYGGTSIISPPGTTAIPCATGVTFYPGSYASSIDNNTGNGNCVTLTTP